MPTYEDPGFFCKFWCAPCAVNQAQGCVCPQMLLACCLGCWYTMLCWNPEEGKPAGAPPTQQMAR